MCQERSRRGYKVRKVVKTTPDPARNPNVVPMIARRREFTARAIEHVGIRLIAEHGYDAVSVATIAAEAGVSRRTFFRYFSSKAELVEASRTRLNLRLLAALRRRIADEPAPEALCNALIENAAADDIDEPEFALLRTRLLHDIRYEDGGVGEIVEEIVRVVATKLGTDPLTDFRARLVVWTVYAAAQAASRTWLESGGERPFNEDLRASCEQVLDGLRSL